MHIERRSVANLEAGKGRLEGYASVFDSLSKDLGGFREIVRPGAFSKTLRATANIVALSGHDVTAVLGSTASGTLTLQEDKKGLRYSITLPDTQASRDLQVLVERGDIRGASFAFRAVLDRWDDTVTPALRELIEVDLFEVSVVAIPAYESSSVAQRHLMQHQHHLQRGHLERWLKIHGRR